MKKIILIFGLLASSFSFGADWRYATSSTDGDDIFIDQGFYKYDVKNRSVDVWTQTKKVNFQDKSQIYISSKSLDRYLCVNKSSKNLAMVNYHEGGSVKSTHTKPDNDFNVIFPDTVAEGIWHVVCDLKGKGFKFPKQMGNISEKEFKKIMENNKGGYQREFVDLNKLRYKSQSNERAPILGNWSEFTAQNENQYPPEYVPSGNLGKNTNNNSKPSITDFDSIDGYVLSIYKYYGVDYPQPYYITEPHGVVPKFDNYKSITDFENAIQNYAQKIKF